MPDSQFERVEDDRLIRGAGRYTADIRVPGMLHAAFVRSPHASAGLVGLDVSGAAAVDGVVAVLTAADLESDGIAPFSAPMQVEGPDRTYGQTPRPLLIGDRVRFVGEPLAIVVAETAGAALEGAEAVVADLRPEAAVSNAKDALAPGAAAVWEDRPGNIAFRWRKGAWDEVEAALGEAAHVARLDTAISRVTAVALEPRAALAAPEDGGRTTLHLSHQNAQGMRAALVAMFKLERESVRVVAPDVGGAFGMKSGPLREEAVVFWAARRLGRPVRWVADRVESFLTDEAGRDARVEAALGLDADGRFTALKVAMTTNVGAYASGRSAVPILNIGGIAGVYRTPLIAGAVTGVFSNTVPTAPYRGAGRPEATFAIERVIDAAARLSGIDPLELRRRNLVPATAMPYTTPFLFAYDSGDFAATMQTAAERADYAGFAARRRAAAERGLLRGIGIANPIEVAGGPFGKPGKDFARIVVDGAGGVTLRCGAMSAGQGLETAMTGLVAAALGVDRGRIRYIQGDTDQVPEGKGMGGSSGLTTGGSAVRRALDAVIERAREIAAETLEVAVADVEYAGGAARVAGTDRTLALSEIAALAAKEDEAGLYGHGEFVPDRPTYPNGCHICEVEIDPGTGQCRVVSYTAVEDIGRVLYPVLAEGQIHGGVAQGLGQAMGEAIRHDGADGQLLTASFMDYAMPRADDLDDCRCSFAEVETMLNPLGVKGVGEAGTVGALAAGSNAVCDALASAGVEDFAMPATPGRIWEALRKARSGR